MTLPALKITADCGCGCGLFGTPRRRPWRNGQICVNRCQCHRCMGSRFRKRASARERSIAKDTGGARVPLSGQGGGADVSGHLVDIEETAKESVVRGVRRWWESKTVRTKVTALYSRALVPRALVLSWEVSPGGPKRRQLVVMTYDDFLELVLERRKWRGNGR